MSLEKVMAYLKEKGFAERVILFDVSSATVELAAAALGCEPKLIAKTLAFKKGDDGAIVIVTAGDTKINNGAFKRRFGFKPTMLSAEGMKANMDALIERVKQREERDNISVLTIRSF